MKKNLFFLLALVLLTSCGTKKFDKTMSLAYEKAKEVTILSEATCDLVTSTWHQAIFENIDHNGDYCSDFNTALYRLNRDLEKQGKLDKIRTAKAELNDCAKAMAKYPDSRQNAYNDFLDYVTNVNALADMATAPDGNLNSYRSSEIELVSQIKKQQDMFELKYGEFLLDVSEEVKKQADAKDEDWD